MSMLRQQSEKVIYSSYGLCVTNRRKQKQLSDECSKGFVMDGYGMMVMIKQNDEQSSESSCKTKL